MEVFGRENGKREMWYHYIRILKNKVTFKNISLKIKYPNSQELYTGFKVEIPILFIERLSCKLLEENLPFPSKG